MRTHHFLRVLLHREETAGVHRKPGPVLEAEKP
jgi:hypothetical protein